ncbi:MAG: TolC family protein, partial [Cyclobacteriaceae bacterium]|nr:TolC family protein [Cyclobacteriaceae bacterium]
SDSASAQEQLPAKLTFKEAVKIGLQNNVVLNQQKNQLQYTQKNKTSSMLQLGPSVQAGGSAYRNDGNSFNQNEGRVVNGVIDYVGGQLSASMPVFNGLAVVNQYRQANNQNEAQLHQVVRSNQDVIRDVSNQYLLCLLDQELVKINIENVATQQIQYDQIKAQVELGSKAEADLYNQEYQLKNSELLLVRARNTLKNDMANLALTLQIDPTIYVEVQQVDWDINKLAADSATFENLYATAVDRRSDLKQAGHAEKAAHYGYSSMKGRYYPSIYAGVNYGSRYNYIQGEDNRSFHDQFTKDNVALSYGFSLTIPIYSGLQYRTQAAFSKVTYENAKIRAKNAEVVVKTDVIRAYQNFKDARTSYETSQAQLRAAETSYKMEKERYDLGISNIVQLSIVNQTYVRAQGDYKTSLFTLMFQRLLINYATGTLQFEDIP